MKASAWPCAAAVILLSGCVSMRPAPPLGSLEPPASTSAPTSSSGVTAEPPERRAEPAQPPAPAPPPTVRAPAPPREPRATTPPSAPPIARPAPPEVVKPAPPEPAPAPPPPVVAVRVPHEEQIAEEVTQRVTRAQEIIDKIDAAKLSRDQREILSSIQDFVTKARDAYQTKDMPRAQVLAEKASRLADDLAASVKR